jgi:hypothetical protein
MSGFGFKRVKALRAVVVMALVASRKALAGWLAMFPWSLFNVVSIVVMGVLVLVVVLVATSGDGGGGGPGGGGGTGTDAGHEGPGLPGEPAGHPSGHGPQARRGSLEIRFDDNVDFRELRFTLSYHPGEPPVPGELLYLRGLREDDDRVRALDAPDILRNPARYGALAAHAESLCRRGYPLSAGSPACRGVLRISPSYTRMRSARAELHALAAETPPLGPAGPQDAVGAVQAQAPLRLAHVFFVVSSGAPDFASRVSLVEQDPDSPAVFRPSAATAGAGGQGTPDPVRRLDLSRDRGRLYLQGPDALAVWRGSGPLQTLYRADFGENLRDATPTDSGVCVAYSRAQQSGMRCLAQDRDNWGPAQTFPRDMDTTELTSAGRGVLALGSEAGAPEQVLGYHVADASPFWLQFREAPVAAEGAQAVEGAMPLKGWPGGREDYLLFGPYPQQCQGFWQLGMLEPGAERSPSFFLPGPGGGQTLRSHDLWRDLAPGVVRVFALTDTVREIDYDLLNHRPVRCARRNLPLDAARLDSLRLLDGEGRDRLLVVSGLRTTAPRSFIALLRYADAASEPQLLSLVDFSDPAQALAPMHRQARVRAISRNALLLRAED